MVRKTKQQLEEAPTFSESWVAGFSPWAKVVWVFPYIAALVFWRDRVPDGLNNDAVEEALRGIYLVGGRRFEVMTLVLGNSAETFYLYIVGLASSLVGPTSLAIQLPGWLFAIAAIGLLYLVTRRLDRSLPGWVPLLLGTSSVWLFHYARSGLRAITSPFFLLLFWLLLDRAESAKGPRWAGLAAGGVLGLGLYSYTSCRVLVIAAFIYGTIRLLQDRKGRRRLLTCYLQVLAGIFIISIPNGLFFFYHPQEFVFRGSYSMPHEVSLVAEGLLWSFLLPFYYPTQFTSEFFDRVFDIDSVSNGLVVAGINPIHIVVAFAFVVGLMRAYRMRHEPGPLFLLVQWLAATFVLGIAGPSLTRLLILLPVYLLFAALGIGRALKWRPSYRLLIVIVLLLPLVTHAYRYFTEVGTSPMSKFYASTVASPMGRRAEVIASQGHRVLCLVSKDANIIRYLTYPDADRVHVSEFYFQPLDVSKIPLQAFKPEFLLIEKSEGFANFAGQFRENLRTTSDVFDEIRLP